MAEKIRILIIKRKMNLSTLATKLGMSQGNLSNKLRRDNFTIKELTEISEALDCDLVCHFQMRDSKENI